MWKTQDHIVTYNMETTDENPAKLLFLRNETDISEYSTI